MRYFTNKSIFSDHCFDIFIIFPTINFFPNWVHSMPDQAIATKTATLPNPLIMFNNHFGRHRREYYSYATRIAIAEDLGYDGFELHAIEPEDDATWREVDHVLRESSLQHAGMYVGCRPEEDRIEQELKRLMQIIDRLATLPLRPYLLLTIPGGPSAQIDEAMWERAARIVAEAEKRMAQHDMHGYIYNHCWFVTDTPQAECRLIEASDSQQLRPGIAAFHAHFVEEAPDPQHIFDLPGMDQLGYFAILNYVPKPAEPFRTVEIDQGEIDIAGWLGLLWSHNYKGPIITQAYDRGGDPYVTGRKAFDYVHDIWNRFQRNPKLNPFANASNE